MFFFTRNRCFTFVAFPQQTINGPTDRHHSSAVKNIKGRSLAHTDEMFCHLEQLQQQGYTGRLGISSSGRHSDREILSPRQICQPSNEEVDQRKDWRDTQTHERHACRETLPPTPSPPTWI